MIFSYQASREIGGGYVPLANVSWDGLGQYPQKVVAEWVRKYREDIQGMEDGIGRARGLCCTG